MKKEILLYFALLLWFVVPAEAQLTIFSSDQEVEADTGDSIELEFQVSNFDSILSIQYSINWDSTVLRLKDVTTTDQLSGFSSGASFGTTLPGTLRSIWAAGNGLGENLPDSSFFYRIKFDVIGKPDSATLVTFSDAPIVREVLATVDGKTTTVQSAYDTVEVKVRGMGTSTFALADQHTTLFQNEPNPFADLTFVKFELQKTDDILFQIFDLKGQLIYAQTETFGTGTHRLQLGADLFPAAGTYLYRLSGTGVSLTKKLVVIK
ncbi:MAG: T9SS type A sorting domain-containing protein [Bacteroidota bacterium]